MRLFRPSAFFRLLYPEGLSRLKTRGKELVLTFDDGPDPASTPHLAEILDRHGIKSFFFCTGRKAEKYPELVSMLRLRGHITGNHGYDHLNGWKTANATYLNNVREASDFTSLEYFRPPYGLLKPGQYRELKKNYRIILWDVMPYDFDKKIGGKECLSILKRMIRPGSVIVLHDTAGSSVHGFIDEFIGYAADSGYSFVTTI
jgi:peptidoglycan/xylan/chitin deacetylase (PgdA/CDA1 family)